MKPIRMQDLLKTVELLEADLGELLKKEKERLMKAHPGEETPAEASSDVSASSPSAPSGDPSPPEVSPASASDSGSESSSSSGSDSGSESSSSGSDSGSSGSGEGAVPGGAAPAGHEAMANDMAPPTHDELVSAYCELTPEQREQHLAALHDAMKTAAGANAAPAPAPDAGQDPAMAPPADDGAMKSEPEVAEALAKAEGLVQQAQGLMKSKEAETDNLRKQVAEIAGRLEKREAELASREAALAESGKQIEAFLRGPERRAVTQDSSSTQKPVTVTTLNKSEVVSKLRKAARQNISDKDRQAINDVLFNGGTLDSVRHLIEATA